VTIFSSELKAGNEDNFLKLCCCCVFYQVVIVLVDAEEEKETADADTNVCLTQCCCCVSYQRVLVAVDAEVEKEVVTTSNISILELMLLCVLQTLLQSTWGGVRGWRKRRATATCHSIRRWRKAWAMTKMSYSSCCCCHVSYQIFIVVNDTGGERGVQ